MEQEILRIEGVSKFYPGVRALDDVTLSFRRGEVHAIAGENGAGKSTLIKTIAGAISPESGKIIIDGKEHKSLTPAKAKELGIEVVYQEFNLIDSLSVAENIFLGDKLSPAYNKSLTESKADELFRQYGLKMDVRQKVERLSPASMQLVEIIKAVSKNARILIMDEPSAPLSTDEVESMYKIIEILKAKGTTILYISHRMEELFKVSDRVSVLRDGQYVATVNTSDTNRKEIVALMVGRELKEGYPVRTAPPGDFALEVQNLKGNGVENISFSVRHGEILGVAGLVGAGRTEMALVIYGAAKKEHGTVRINGKAADIHSPHDALAAGIGLIPEDRKRSGCLLESSVQFNLTISSIKKMSRGLFVKSGEVKKQSEYYRDKLSIRTPSLMQRVKNLSGGNQQKVVIGKTLGAGSGILIFDEPTRGIDVGAKQEIYHLMNELATAGNAIIMISSDMVELIGMSDRMIVISEGELAGELTKSQFDQRTIIDLASGRH